jgi:hypothetical protein
MIEVEVGCGASNATEAWEGARTGRPATGVGHLLPDLASHRGFPSNF